MRSAVLALMTMGVLNGAQHLVEGSAQSQVRVLIYEDLQCPDCADFRAMLDSKLLPKYGDRVAFEHRDFPLAKHAWARRAAVASRYFESKSPALAVQWRQYAMSHIATISADSFADRLREFAVKHGQDGVAAVAALGDVHLQELVEQDFQDGIARGIARTPTALVNGQPFIETFTVEEISKAIEGELAAGKVK